MDILVGFFALVTTFLGGNLTLIIGIGVFLWFVLWVFSRDPPKTRAPQEGAQVATFEDIKKAGLVGETGLRLGYKHKTVLSDKKKEETTWHALRYAGENHLITVGKPGSGKGASVIIPNLLDHPGSCFVIDPKGQNAAVTCSARQKVLQNSVFCLNPYRLHPRWLGEPKRFNPLAQLDPESINFVGDVGSLASALIYQTGNDPHWSDSARELVACLIMYVCLQSGETRTLPRVRQLLCLPDLDDEADEQESGQKTATPLTFSGIVAEMSFSPFTPLATKAAQFTDQTREIKSIISQARTQTAFLDDPAIAESVSASDFDFADMKRKRITVFLILPAKHLRAQSRWLRLLVTSAIDALTGEPQRGDERVLFILDEFAQLGRLESIEKALALVRGYGVQLWPFVQDLPQLKGVYPDRWESFLATAGVTQFFTPNDETTAKYISDRCGMRVVTRKSTSESTSKNDDRKPTESSSSSYADHWEPLFRPWELYGDFFEGFVTLLFKEGLSHVVVGSKLSYFKDENLKGIKARLLDPYHLPPETKVAEEKTSA